MLTLRLRLALEQMSDSKQRCREEKDDCQQRNDPTAGKALCNLRADRSADETARDERSGVRSTTNEDVADTTCGFMRARTRKSGTITNPPPIPKMLDARPMSAPAPIASGIERPNGASSSVALVPAPRRRSVNIPRLTSMVP